jgi:hypothetical protein
MFPCCTRLRHWLFVPGECRYVPKRMNIQRAAQKGFFSCPSADETLFIALRFQQSPFLFFLLETQNNAGFKLDSLTITSTAGT